MVELRITKYSPLLRNEQGWYTADDWISVSDIGRVFNGNLLTLEEYLRVESQHVSVVEQMMKIAGVSELCISWLEMSTCDYIPAELREESNALRELVFEGMCADAELALKIVSLVLRGVIWCRLTGDRDFYVHFGYDYYMYAGYDGEMADIEGIETPLFLEPFTSPHHPYLDEDD